jgi:hypothetical protein
MKNMQLGFLRCHARNRLEKVILHYKEEGLKK